MIGASVHLASREIRVYNKLLKEEKLEAETNQIIPGPEAAGDQVQEGIKNDAENNEEEKNASVEDGEGQN